MDIETVAADIFKKLNDKHAFTKTLPFHLDRDKFRHLVENDIREVLEDHQTKEKQG